MRELSIDINAEKDKAANRPLDLYRLYLPHTTLYLASSMEDIEFFDEDDNPQTYSGYDISRGDIQTDISLSNQEVSVNIGNIDLDFSTLLRTTEIRNAVVEILKVFRGHLDSAAHGIKMFTGRIDGVSLDQETLAITVVGRIDLVERQLPARKYTIFCPWEFGDEICGVDVPTTSGMVTDTDETGRIITTDAVSGSEDNEWIYGNITIGDESRYILNSTNEEVTVDVPFLYAIEGEPCEIEAGCSKFYGQEEDEEVGDMHGCQYWDNTDKFGGFLNIPDGKDVPS